VHGIFLFAAFFAVGWLSPLRQGPFTSPRLTQRPQALSASCQFG
jgi:hypothetical protein